MPGPSQRTLAKAAGAHIAYMLDECVIQWRVTGSVDAYGTPSETWVSGAKQVCSFKTNTSKELLGTAQVDAADAVLRLPEDVNIEVGYRVQITKRMNTELDTPLLFNVTGKIERGQFGLAAPLKLYTGSDNA